MANPVKVTKSFFSGLSKVFAADDGLSRVVRELSADLARLKLQQLATAAEITDFTDSSTGTAAATFADMVQPVAAFDATSANGATRTDFNTAVDTVENAMAVLADGLNRARARVGFNAMSAPGTITTAFTVPAVTKSVNTTNGATSLDYSDGVLKMLIVKRNMKHLVGAWNELRVAMGFTPIADAINIPTGYTASLALAAVANAAASATGASAISKAVADTFLTKCADNIATMAAQWNLIFASGGGLADLTDSTGGTASTTVLAANTIPSAAAGAATTSAPKAGFDTELVVIEANQADIMNRMNALRAGFGMSVYTNSTGVTPDTTLAAMGVALTAVDGSSGTSAVDQATARARMQTIQNNFASLCVGINELADLYGWTQITNQIVGSVASTTIADIAATGTGVGGATPVTLLDSEVDAWLVINRNHVSTLAAKLAQFTAGTGLTTATILSKPTGVVAA
jgi:hypothetical protein